MVYCKQPRFQRITAFVVQNITARQPGCVKMALRWRISRISEIFGDPETVSRVGIIGGTNVFKQGWKSPWVQTLTRPFQNGQANAGSRLGRNAFIIVLDRRIAHPEFFLCVWDGYCLAIQELNFPTEPQWKKWRNSCMINSTEIAEYWSFCSKYRACHSCFIGQWNSFKECFFMILRDTDQKLSCTSLSSLQGAEKIEPGNVPNDLWTMCNVESDWFWQRSSVNTRIIVRHGSARLQLCARFSHKVRSVRQIFLSIALLGNCM